MRPCGPPLAGLIDASCSAGVALILCRIQFRHPAPLASLDGKGSLDRSIAVQSWFDIRPGDSTILTPSDSTILPSLPDRDCCDRLRHLP